MRFILLFSVDEKQQFIFLRFLVTVFATKSRDSLGMGQMTLVTSVLYGPSCLELK